MATFLAVFPVLVLCHLLVRLCENIAAFQATKFWNWRAGYWSFVAGVGGTRSR